MGKGVAHQGLPWKHLEYRITDDGVQGAMGPGGPIPRRELIEDVTADQRALPGQNRCPQRDKHGGRGQRQRSPAADGGPLPCWPR